MSNVMKIVLLGLVVVAFVVMAACGGGGGATKELNILGSALDLTATPAPEVTAVSVPASQPEATPTTASAASTVATTAATATTAPVAPTVEPTPEGPDLSRFAEVEGIVDPTNFGWPRTVETSEGIVTLDAPPQRIHSLSLGHSEILAALIDFDRLTAVYSFFVDEEQSNIATLSTDHNMIGYDPEEVVALQPEVIIASRFTNADTVALMVGAKIPVVRTNLENSALGNVPNILLMGYMFGAEEEALELAAQIEARMDVLNDLLPDGEKPRVLSIASYTSIYAAGSGTTEGGIIEQAGGINAAADSDIEGHQQISVESVAAINPDVIIVPQPMDGADVFIEDLLSNPALAEIPAVKNGQVYYALPRHHTTLSHWNVRGIEELAKLLYPEAFSGVVFEDFSNWSE